MNTIRTQCTKLFRPRILVVALVCASLLGAAGCSRKADTPPPAARAMSRGGPQEAALVQAIEAGQIDKVKSLVAQGADVNAVDLIGRTPFHSAAFYNRGDVAELLLSKSAKVNSPDVYGLTPLHAAVLAGSKPLVELLIREGADVNAATAAGITPLHLAAATGQVPMVEVLLRHKADINRKDEDGHGAWYFAAVNDHDDAQDALKKAGAKSEPLPKG